MQRKILLMIIMLITASLVVPAFSTSLDVSGDGPKYKYYVNGYVVTSEADGNTPLGDVDINIIYSSEITYSATSNDAGFFSVGINENTNLEIGFFREGYTLRSCPDITIQEHSEYYFLDLTNVKFNLDNSKSTYTLTSESDGMQCALMMKSTGSLNGTVTYDGGNIEGAEVKLTSDSNPNLVYRTTTNSDGSYEISNCATGPYILVVTCNGFTKSSENAITIDDETSTLNVTLTESNINIFFGIDLAHVLMIVGIIVGIILGGLTWVIIKRLKQNQDGLIVLDNLEDDEDDDFKYHP